MTCPSSTDLSRLARGEMDEAGQDELNAHLSACAHCDALFENLKQANLFRPILPDSPPVWERTTLADSAPAPEAQGGRSMPPGYEFIEELGRGTMGVVYRARQVALHREVALKMILAGGHASKSMLARFHTEAEAIARLHHPGIVQVFAVGEHEGLPYFSMEYCEGGSLKAMLDTKKLAPREAAERVEKLARAVQAAHDSNIVHRDLKPENVLLTRDGIMKVADFGLAKPLDAKGQTLTGLVMGTPAYMAPEQAQGSKDVGPPADIYALGAILYELLIGRPPLLVASLRDTMKQSTDEPISPRSLVSSVPRDLETICLKCLRQEPKKRYESASELAEDLLRFLLDKPIKARTRGAAERTLRWVRRNWIVTTSAVAVAASLAIIAAREANLRTSSQKELGKLTGLLGDLEPLGLKGRPFGTEGQTADSKTLDSYVDTVRSPMLTDRPDIRASLLSKIGNLYRTRGQYTKARPLLEEAVVLRGKPGGGSMAERASSMYYLAWLDHDQGFYEEAHSHYGEALDLSRQTEDATLTDSIRFGQAWLAADLHDKEAAEEGFSRVLKSRTDHRHSDHQDIALCQLGVAFVLIDREKEPEAATLAAAAVSWFDKQLDERRFISKSIKTFLQGVGARTSASTEKGKNKMDLLNASEKKLTDSIDLGCLLLGERHPHVTSARVELARTLEAMNKNDEAVALYRRTLRASPVAEGHYHPRVLSRLKDLARLLKRMGQHGEAEKELSDHLAARQKQLGKTRLYLVADVLTVIGEVYSSSDPRQAAHYYRQADAIYADYEKNHEPMRFRRFRVICNKGLSNLPSR